MALTEGGKPASSAVTAATRCQSDLANGKGLTYFSATSFAAVWSTKTFLNYSTIWGQRTRIDRWRSTSRTTWAELRCNWALAHGLMITAEFLLRRGADPNIANASGETALHAVCKFPSRGPRRGITTTAIDTSRCELTHGTAKVKQPLELAVANHMPDALEVLLDHGADIAGFVYPAANYVDDELEWIIDVKWRELLGALLCAKRLAKRGYELIWSDALKIMKMFARYGFFEKSDVDLQRSLLDNEGFASRAKSLFGEGGPSAPRPNPVAATRRSR
ncbi:unnamed protein product [Trichogramma brassicae]|uniref:Uncharacterized protein n=1 Tax=Trichogramma brassicae TaxID=86971 RepID=A0A6H5IKQ3_9HYME|nr:unnamed protein product [Trichogramma brassicae]